MVYFFVSAIFKLDSFSVIAESELLKSKLFWKSALTGNHKTWGISNVCVGD